ncbi:unnamed protein product [Sphagnum jensenii]|uniref:PPIase cyclophilin-type domain-containing protein n=1 Tax=Sphagnum jensenii TaxID=128206 RepID=A0ABP0XDB4_9BRYO
MIPVGGLQMAKRSYSCSGSSNGNNNVDHLRRRATHGNGSASSSDGEDGHDSIPPRKLLKSNGPQLRNAENFISWAALIVQLTILCYICTEEVNLDGFMFTGEITISSFLAIYSSSLDCTRRLQLLPRPEPSEEYCPLYTLVDDAGACRTFGFCFRTMKWVGLRHVPESTSRRSVTLPVASAGGLLFYTEDGHSSEDVLVVNPLTGEHKILGIPTLDNGALASLEEAQAEGDDHENGDDRSEADAEDGSVVVSDESELDEVSDSVEESSLPVTKRVFFDITIDGQPAGQIVIGLFGDNVPIGAQRFFELSTGKRGIGYRKKEFYKIGRNYIQNVGVRAFSLTGGSEDAAKFTGGDTADQLIMEMKELERKGTRPKNKKWAVSLVAIDATKPPPKTRLVARDGAFVIVEEESRPDPNGTEFMILTADAPELDDTNTVVGEVIQGMDVVDRISNVKVVQENTSSPYFQVAKFIGDTRAVVAEKGFNRPYSKVLISKSGEIR